LETFNYARDILSAAPTLGRAALFLAALNLEVQPIHTGILTAQ
jgi:hypothetical protein